MADRQRPRQGRGLLVKLPTTLDLVFSQLMPILGRVAVMLTIRRLNRSVVQTLIVILRESADRLEISYKEDYGG